MKRNYYQYSFEDIWGEKWESDPVPFQKKQESGQVELEDYYDASVLGMESREEFIHRKFSDLPKCRIMQQTIVAGDRVEVNIYPYFLRRKDIPRVKPVKESREAQKKLNQKNSQKKLIRLMCANFHKGDLILTLTYEDGYYPTPEQAKKDMANFIKRLKRRRKKQGLPELKYIYVTEHVPEGEHTKKVRIHHHMIINHMDRDEAETCWGMGRAESKWAQPDDFELEGFARYISKLSVEKHHHKWTGSRNLEKPKEYKTVTKLSRRKFREIILSGDQKKELLESLYKGKLIYLDSTTYYNQEYGGFYLYSRLRRKESVWEEVKPREDSITENAGDRVNTRPDGTLGCRAFLEYDWSGTLADGEATYSILFEAIYNGEPVTKEYYGRFAHTTKNRAMLYIAKTALTKLRHCAVEFHVDSAILEAGVNQERFRKQKESGYKNIKNADLIEDFLKAAEGFDISVVREETNEYTPAMQMQREIKKEKLHIVRDWREK